MLNGLKWTGFILLAALVGLVLAVAFVAGARAQSPATVIRGAWAPASLRNNPWGAWSGYGYGPGGFYSSTAQSPYYGYGPGMMVWNQGNSGSGGWGMGPSMMGGYGGWGMGPGMHAGMMGAYGGWGDPYGVTPPGTPVPVDQEIELVASNFRFDPARVTVTAGQTVRLVVANQDGVPHNLYGTDLPIAYAVLPAGLTRSVTFTAPTSPGTYLAVCTFHPGMAVEIVVE
jgi:plastocyanin